MDVGTSEDIYWNGTTFGPDQEVYLTLTSIDPNGSEIGLILKSQSNSSITGMIVAVYNPVPKYVQVWTYAPSQGWQARGNSIPVIFANGDQFGARATTNGNVEIYQNGTLLATRSVTAWPSYAGSGYIGVFPLSASNTVLDDFGGGTVDPAPIATSTPPPQGNEDVLYLSSTSNGNVGGIALNDEDIVTYDSATDTWSLYFDGSDIGITGDVNAFSIMNDGSILLSLDAAVTLNGLGTVDDSDILHFIPTSVGSNTSGTLSFYTIGSNVGLTASGENIDAIDFTPDGRLLVSTGGSYSVPGISGGDEDLIALDSSGSSWTLYFDGSDVGLNESNSEDISGVWIDPTNNQIHLTTVGSFSVVGLDGGGADIFICTPTALGSTTACTFNSYWIGSLQGFSSEIIDGLDISK